MKYRDFYEIMSVHQRRFTWRLPAAPKEQDPPGAKARRQGRIAAPERRRQ
jgi:hypothetical protein